MLNSRFGKSTDLCLRGTEPEPSISDAVCAIVYAAPRTELKELQNLREMLMHKVYPNATAPLSTIINISTSTSQFPYKVLITSFDSTADSSL